MALGKIIWLNEQHTSHIGQSGDYNLNRYATASYVYVCISSYQTTYICVYIKVAVKWLTHTINSFINIVDTKPFTTEL